MNLPDLLSAAGQFGSMGLLVGYIVWDKTRIDAKWRKIEEQRIAQEQARIEADKGLALALQALTIAIQSSR